MNYRILIADEDLSYLSKLELMLLREYSQQIELMLVTDKYYLDEFFQSPRKIDVLIIDEGFWKDEYRRQGIPHLFFLSENETPVRSEQGVTSIYKYSSVQSVIHSINIVLKRLIRGNVGNPEKKIVMVYSPQGGSGKTTLALGTAKALFKLGNRVLYINTETIQTFNGKESETGWAHRSLISALSTGRFTEDILADNIAKGDVDYILPMQYSLLGNGLCDMNYISLVHMAKEVLPYDYIVVDTSSDFNDFKAQMIAMSDQVVIPCLQDEQGAIKMEAMLRNLNASDKNKYIFVCNKYQIGEKNCLMETPAWQMLHFKIPYRDLKTESDDGQNLFMEVAYSLI